MIICWWVGQKENGEVRVNEKRGEVTLTRVFGPKWGEHEALYCSKIDIYRVHVWRYIASYIKFISLMGKTLALKVIGTSHRVPFHRLHETTQTNGSKSIKRTPINYILQKTQLNHSSDISSQPKILIYLSNVKTNIDMARYAIFHNPRLWILAGRQQTKFPINMTSPNTS